MTRARRRWLITAAVVLALVASVLAWKAVQSDRRDDAAQPVPSVTSIAGDGGVTGGTGTGTTGGSGAATPSNTLGAPVPAPEAQSQSQASSDASVDGSPLAPWWQRVPPVEGDLIPIDRFASGHVRIERDDQDGLVITFRDFEVAKNDRALRSVRVWLSGGAVTGERRGYWLQEGGLFDVGDMPTDTRTLVISVTDPDRLPDPVHSVVLLDPDTGDILGGAPLLPVD